MSDLEFFEVEQKFYNCFPKVIRSWRKTRGITQEKLCSDIQMSVNQYRDYESGRSYPSLFNFYRIYSFYDFPDFFDFE